MSETGRKPSSIPIRHAIPPEETEWRDRWLAELPELELLARALEHVFSSEVAGPPRVIDRELNMSWSTAPSEIATCSFSSGRELRVLCKYARPSRDGHSERRRGLSYEALVYGRLLGEAPLPTPALYGLYTDTAADLQLLAVQYLEQGTRLHKLEEPGLPPVAAHSIGTFHAALASRSSDSSLAFLERYDADYYRSWVRRTAEFAAQADGPHRWIIDLANRADDFIGLLIEAEPTIVHGEFYPDNIIVRDRVPYVIDWESAAIAPGEIDLASLTGRWPQELVLRCERAYRASRWPSTAPPANHGVVLAAARLYLHFRWLGDRRDQFGSERLRWRFDQLRLDAERLNLL